MASTVSASIPDRDSPWRPQGDHSVALPGGRQVVAPLALLLLLSTSHSWTTALVRPMFQVSDEISYVGAIQQQALQGTTDPSDAATLAPPRGATVVRFPSGKMAFRGALAPLYSALARWFDAASALLIVRLLLATACGSATLATWLLARHVAPGNPMVVWGAPTFVALHPLFAAYSSAVAPDAIANALAAWAFLLLVRFSDGSAKRLEPLACLACVGGAAAVKDTGLALVPMMLLAYLVRLRRASNGGVAGGRRFHGDPWLPGLPLLVASVVLYPPVRAALWSVHLDRAAIGSRDATDLLRDSVPLAAAAFETSTRTFWSDLGNFGGNVVHLPEAASTVLLGLMALASLGFASRLIRSQRSERPALLFLLCGAALAFLQPVTREVMVGAGDAVQGRWLFVAMAPIAVLVSAGLSAFVPPRRALPLFAAVLSGGAAVATLGVLVPTYYDQFPSTYNAGALYLSGAYGGAVENDAVELLLSRPEWAAGVLTWLALAGWVWALLAWPIACRRLADRVAANSGLDNDAGGYLR